MGRIAAAPGVKEGVTDMEGVFEDVGVLLGVPVFVCVGVGVLEKDIVVEVEGVGVLVDESDEPGEGVEELEGVADGDVDGERGRHAVSVMKPLDPVAVEPPAYESVAESYDGTRTGFTYEEPPPPPDGNEVEPYAPPPPPYQPPPPPPPAYDAWLHAKPPTPKPAPPLLPVVVAQQPPLPPFRPDPGSAYVV